MGDHTGQRLGNYRLLRLIGQGGFADVYLGEHIHLRTQAAIKILQVRLGENSIQDFLNEARTIAHLVHPYIIRVLDFGVQENIPFLVMDYAPRGTLRLRFLQGKPLAPGPFVPFIKQAASALHYGHERKLIHRDVKPENMLLGVNDEVLLSDFGLAMIAFGSFSRATAQTAGTAAYMSPEQLQGKPRPASDQYSLAVIAYEWLTGTTPFQGSFYEIASQQMIAPVPPIHERIAGFPASIEKVVMTALEKDPQRRFPSVRDFALAFEEACQNQPQNTGALSTQAKTTQNASSLSSNDAESTAKADGTHAKSSSLSSSLGSNIVDPFEILSAARKNSALLDDPSLFGPWDKPNPATEKQASALASEASSAQQQTSTKTSTANPTKNTTSAFGSPVTGDLFSNERERKSRSGIERHSENAPDQKKSLTEQLGNKNHESNRSIFTREEHVVSRFDPLPSQSNNYPTFAALNENANKNQPGSHTAKLNAGLSDQFTLPEMKNINSSRQGNQPLAPQQPLHNFNQANSLNDISSGNGVNPISNNIPQNRLSGSISQQNSRFSADYAAPNSPPSVPGFGNNPAQASLSGIPVVNPPNPFPINPAQASLSGIPGLNPPNSFPINPAQASLSGIPVVNPPNPFPINPAQVSLSGIPGLNPPNPLPINPAQVSLAGIPGLNPPNPFPINPAQVSLSGIPGLNPSNSFPINPAQASLSGIPAINPAQASLSGIPSVNPAHNTLSGIPIVNNSQISFPNVPDTNNPQNPFANNLSNRPVNNVPSTNNTNSSFFSQAAQKPLSGIPVNGFTQNIHSEMGTAAQDPNSFTVNLAQSTFINNPSTNNPLINVGTNSATINPMSGNLPGSAYGFQQNAPIQQNIAINGIVNNQLPNTHMLPGQLNASAHMPSLPDIAMKSRNSNLPPLVDMNAIPEDSEKEEAVQQSLTRNIGMDIPRNIPSHQAIAPITGKSPGTEKNQPAAVPPTKRTFGLVKYILITLVIIILFGSLMGGVYMISRNYTSPTPINSSPISAEPTVHTQSANYPTIAAVSATPSPNANGNPYVTTATSTLSINDPMTSNQYGWHEGVRHPSNGVCTFTASGYRVVAPSKIPVTLCAAEKTNFTQFTYQVNLQFNSAAGAYSGAGIAFYANATTNEYYYFELYTLGGYTLRDCTAAGCENYLATGNTPTNAFKANTGDTNTLAVVVNSKTISMYLNKQLITKFNSSTLTLNSSNTEIGIAANAGYNANTGAYPMTTVTFSNAMLWKE